MHCNEIRHLDEVAAISAGYPFRGKIQELQGGGIAVVQMKDVSESGGIKWSGCLETVLPGKREPDWLQPGNILIAARGSRHYAVRVGEDVPDNSRAVAAPHFFVISQLRQDVLPAYLEWLLNQLPCQRYLEQNAEGTLTKSIRRVVLDKTPVAIPSLRQQETILQLASTLRQEQLLAEQLLRNGETLLSSIACDLLQAAGHSPRKAVHE